MFAEGEVPSSPAGTAGTIPPPVRARGGPRGLQSRPCRSGVAPPAAGRSRPVRSPAWGSCARAPESEGGPLVEFACPRCGVRMRLIPHGQGRYALPGRAARPRRSPGRSARPRGSAASRPRPPGEPPRLPPGAASPGAAAGSRAGTRRRPPTPPPPAAPAQDAEEAPLTVPVALEILGVEPTAARREIERAFREKSQTLPPGQGGPPRPRVPGARGAQVQAPQERLRPPRALIRGRRRGARGRDVLAPPVIPDRMGARSWPSEGPSREGAAVSLLRCPLQRGAPERRGHLRVPPLRPRRPRGRARAAAAAPFSRACCWPDWPCCWACCSTRIPASDSGSRGGRGSSCRATPRSPRKVTSCSGPCAGLWAAVSALGHRAPLAERALGRPGVRPDPRVHPIRDSASWASTRTSSRSSPWSRWRPGSSCCATQGRSPSPGSSRSAPDSSSRGSSSSRSRRRHPRCGRWWTTCAASSTAASGPTRSHRCSSPGWRCCSPVWSASVAGLGVGGRGWVGTGLTLLLVTLLLPALSDLVGRLGEDDPWGDVGRIVAEHGTAALVTSGLALVAPGQPRRRGSRPQPEGHRIDDERRRRRLRPREPGGGDDTPAEGTPFPAGSKPGGGLHHPTGESARPRTPGRPPDGAPRPLRPEAPKEPATGLPFPFRPGFLLVLGALVLARAVGGGLFSGPAAADAWPWTLFQTEGGAVTFTWDAAHVFTALGAFFAVFFLLTPFGPAVRSRGATVLTVAALGLVIFPPLEILDRMAALLGLAAAAVLAREGLRSEAGRPRLRVRDGPAARRLPLLPDRAARRGVRRPGARRRPGPVRGRRLRRRPARAAHRPGPLLHPGLPGRPAVLARDRRALERLGRRRRALPGSPRSPAPGLAGLGHGVRHLPRRVGGRGRTGSRPPSWPSRCRYRRARSTPAGPERPGKLRPGVPC